ncbi:hypothetical protein AGMMS49959_11080 [Planctomycetales bacterium]|nr:hypothetical protein AGMMS49959_11080 [Planctomycetales bacterium]
MVEKKITGERRETGGERRVKKAFGGEGGQGEFRLNDEGKFLINNSQLTINNDGVLTVKIASRNAQFLIITPQLLIVNC